MTPTSTRRLGARRARPRRGGGGMRRAWGSPEENEWPTTSMLARFAAIRRGRLARRLPAVVSRCRLVGPDLTARESMQTRDGNQQGPQDHAEGQQGEKTRARFQEQIHQPIYRDDEESSDNDGESEGSRDDRQRR